MQSLLQPTAPFENADGILIVYLQTEEFCPLSEAFQELHSKTEHFHSKSILGILPFPHSLALAARTSTNAKVRQSPPPTFVGLR